MDIHFNSFAIGLGVGLGIGLLITIIVAISIGMKRRASIGENISKRERKMVYGLWSVAASILSIPGLVYIFSISYESGMPANKMTLGRYLLIASFILSISGLVLGGFGVKRDHFLYKAFSIIGIILGVPIALFSGIAVYVICFDG